MSMPGVWREFLKVKFHCPSQLSVLLKAAAGPGTWTALSQFLPAIFVIQLGSASWPSSTSRHFRLANAKSTLGVTSWIGDRDHDSVQVTVSGGPAGVGGRAPWPRGRPGPPHRRRGPARSRHDNLNLNVIFGTLKRCHLMKTGSLGAGHFAYTEQLRVQINEWTDDHDLRAR